MAGTFQFKCPTCGGFLEFDPGKGKAICPYCGSAFDEKELEEESARREAEARQGETGGADSLKEYHCQMCGAEIVTDATTAATRCYFCHNPVVITDRISNEYQPDGIIPFRFNREEARQKFDEYLRKHHFTDRRFFSEAQLEDFSGVYYPYWIGSIVGDATYSGEGKTVSTATIGNDIVTTTRYYRLERAGRIAYRNMIRKALGKADRQLSDGIHPYDQEEMKPFASGYLSGFLAEKRDVDQITAQDSMVQEATGYTERLMTENTGLSGLKGQASFTPDTVNLRYALLPAWVLTWKHPAGKKIYYYMMNGQNGKICGRIPLNWLKLLILCGGVGAMVFGLMCLGGAYLW